MNEVNTINDNLNAFLESHGDPIESGIYLCMDFIWLSKEEIIQKVFNNFI